MKLVSFTFLLLNLAPTVFGALMNLRSSHVVKNEAEPVKVLLLTEALWYAMLKIFHSGIFGVLSGTDSHPYPYQLSIFYSPGCEDFLKTTLKETYKTLGPSVMDLTIIPYGNALIDTENKTVQCQHGLGECDANTYELCAIESYPDPQVYVPFLTCMANKLTPGFRKDKFPPDDFKACAEENHMFWPSIAGCHCCHGYEILAKAAQATPEHQYVPWVEINGNVMDSDDDFMTAICQAYKAQGGDVPECDAAALVGHIMPRQTASSITTCPVASLDLSLDVTTKID